MQLEIGNIVEGKVTGITKFGAFVELPDGKTGMVHISEVSTAYVKEISDHLSENQVVKVKVINITPEGKVSLSIKKCQSAPAPQSPPRQKRSYGPRRDTWQPPKSSNENMSFEDMLSKFKQTSDDKMSDLRRNSDVRRASRRGQSR